MVTLLQIGDIPDHPPGRFYERLDEKSALADVPVRTDDGRMTTR
jgi:hypothetical protein